MLCASWVYDKFGLLLSHSFHSTIIIRFAYLSNIIKYHKFCLRRHTPMLLLPMHATQTQDSETETETEERENILPIQNRLSDFGSVTETAWPWTPRSAYVMNLFSAILALSTWIKLNQLITKLPSKFPSHQYEWRFHPRRVSQPAMPDMHTPPSSCSSIACIHQNLEKL